MLSAYKNLGFDIKDYPNAYEMYENAITLPLHTKLTDSFLLARIPGYRLNCTNPNAAIISVILHL